LYLSGLSALRACPVSRRYYDRKRGEGKSHLQAMLSLARGRRNVLWPCSVTAQVMLRWRPILPPGTGSRSCCLHGRAAGCPS
jgi:hypothetical protein